MKNNSIESSSISRRDFLKLKSLLLSWFYFLNFVGVDILATQTTTKVDYSLLDKLLKLPFSDEVMKELTLRVRLQKQYCTDANGNLHSLDRFLKEMINFIVYKNDLRDFKLLSSIKDRQIDTTYMLNTTAKHNASISMQYFQQKLLGYKDNSMLVDALVYAVKSQSFDTTIALMKQKLQLSKKVKQTILNTLQKEEYDIFCKKLNTTNNKMLLPNKNIKIDELRHIPKKELRFYLGDGIYGDTGEQLYAVIYNSVADLYMQYIIEDFEVRLDNEKVYIQTWSKTYPIRFFRVFEEVLKSNGYENIYENNQMLELRDFLKFRQYNEKSLYQCVDSNEFEYGIDYYDLINIEIL